MAGVRVLAEATDFFLVRSFLLLSGELPIVTVSLSLKGKAGP
jgi:hypothetical protein